MTTLEYMEKQLKKHELNYTRECDRGAPEEVRENILNKIHHYSEVVELLKEGAK